MVIKCKNCKSILDKKQRSLSCPRCSAAAVEVFYELPENKSLKFNSNDPGIWHYQPLLPFFTHQITLGEGQTSLRRATRLLTNQLDLWFKIEGENPTGSFLDRTAALMVSDALDQQKNTVICASDGNLGASLSAYCAKAGLKSLCVVPKSASPEKKVQMVAHGAELIDYGETIDESLTFARKMVDKKTYQATPEYNLLASEGSKTIAFEIVEQYFTKGKSTSKTKKGLSEKGIEFIIVPLGSGKLLYSLWKGFQQTQKFGLYPEDIPLPKIIGVQVKGFDQIAKAVQKGEQLPPYESLGKKSQVIHRNILADAILAQQSIFGKKALECINKSGGTAIAIEEDSLMSSSKKLGKQEGLFAEISSVTVIAGLEELLEQNYFEKNAVVVSILTASGLKTSQAFQKQTTTKKRVESFRQMGTKIEILELIQSEEADFGYGIWKALGQSISLQAVYQHLKELLEAKHIVVKDSGGRQKNYEITDKGRQLLQKLQELEELIG